MKKILLLMFILVLCTVTAYAHPGRTDAYGGHYDNETGEYHYHCNGNPPHLHNEDGSCPYNETEKAVSEPKPASYSNVTPKPELHIQTPNPLTPTLSPPIALMQDREETIMTTAPTAPPSNKKPINMTLFTAVPTIICIISILITSILHEKDIKKIDKEHAEEIKALKQKHKSEISDMEQRYKREIADINKKHISEMWKFWEDIKSGNFTPPSPPTPEGYGIDENGLPYKLNREYGWGKEFNVFVTQNGHCYHRSYCKALKGKGKVKTILHRYDAIKQGYDACPHCEPKSKVDDWYIKLFPNSPYSKLSEKNQNKANEKIQQ